MAFSTAHDLYTFHGKLPGGEDWSIGVRSDGGVLESPVTLTETALAAANRFAEMRNALATGNAQLNPAPWADGTTFEGVTARFVDVNGKTVSQTDVRPTTAMPASASAAYLPNQCCVVVTLLTAAAGRSAKGRVYLPLLGNPILTDGRLGQAARVVSEFSRFLSSTLSDWQALTGQTAERWVVASRTNGDINPITAVRVGNVIDTQRRRRSSLPETYSNAAVTIGA